MRVTRKKIIEAVHQRTGVNADYIELNKFVDGYAWGAKSGACFDETNTSCLALPSIASMTDDFEHKLRNWYKSQPSRLEGATARTMGSELNRYIESINWSLEFE